MRKVSDYRVALQQAQDLQSYLLAESGLPGPRGNIELAQAVADFGDETLFIHLLTFTPDVAPTNSPQEFLAFCGAVGLGRLVAAGQTQWLAPLRKLASDPRWRTREGVAMALQRVGDRDMPMLIAVMAQWSKGSLLEQRAAAAALCEPRLLRNPAQVERVLDILDDITSALSRQQDRKNEDFKTLRKALAYCWSVAVAALPDEGKRRMERWSASPDKDVRWLMRENLKKNRLARMDRAWVYKMAVVYSAHIETTSS
ncbi:MAG TPA: hypothetical protein VGK81_03995 [Anaerolineae bacterium]